MILLAKIKKNKNQTLQAETFEAKQNFENLAKKSSKKNSESCVYILVEQHAGLPSQTQRTQREKKIKKKIQDIYTKVKNPTS